MTINIKSLLMPCYIMSYHTICMDKVNSSLSYYCRRREAGMLFV